MKLESKTEGKPDEEVRYLFGRGSMHEQGTILLSLLLEIRAKVNQ